MRHKSSVDPQSLGLQSHTACKTLIWIHPTQQSSHLLPSPDRQHSSPLCWLCRRKSPGKCRKLFFFSLFFHQGRASSYNSASGWQWSLQFPWLLQFTVWGKGEATESSGRAFLSVRPTRTQTTRVFLSSRDAFNLGMKKRALVSPCYS